MYDRRRARVRDGTAYSTIHNYSYHYKYTNYKIAKFNLHAPKSPLIVVLRGRRRRAGARGILIAAMSIATPSVSIAQHARVGPLESEAQ